jgi:hypothetical protein
MQLTMVRTVVLMYLNNKGIYKMDVDHPEMPAIWEILVYTAGFVSFMDDFLSFRTKK